MVALDIPQGLMHARVSPYDRVAIGTAVRYYTLRTEHLEGCPMCGSAPAIKHKRGGHGDPEGWFMGCACGVRGKTFSLGYDGQDPHECSSKALRQWNTRHNQRNT